MSKICQLTGTKVQTGNNVPKSNQKTKRVFLPNIQNVSLKSDILSSTFYLKLSTRALRTVLKYGSLDTYLLSTKANNLTEYGRNLRIKIKRKIKTNALKSV